VKYPFDHIDHRVRSIAAVRAFYDALMPALGYTDVQAGRTTVEYYSPDSTNQFFGIHQARNHAPTDTRVAFAAARRTDVDRVGRLLRSIGPRRSKGRKTAPITRSRITPCFSKIPKATSSRSAAAAERPGSPTLDFALQSTVYFA